MGRATSNPKLNARQQKAIKLFTEKLIKGEHIVKEHILREAGYSETTARQSSATMEGIYPEIEPIIARMQAHREKVLDQMEAKVATAGYGDLVRSLDVTTKNVQLLGGRPTQNVAMIAEVRMKLDALFD